MHVRAFIILSSMLLALSCSAAPSRGPCSPRARSGPAPAGASRAAPAVAGLPDTQIGLDKHGISAWPTPTPFAYDETPPTGAPLATRDWYEMPPLIPHTVEDMLPLTREENLCRECHDPSNADRAEGDGKPIPKSHFVDYRANPVRLSAELPGTRYDCVACHQVRTDAKPLVGSTYRK